MATFARAIAWARGSAPAVWLMRRLGLRHNRLRRTSDRLEVWTMLLLVLMFLTAIPLAVIAGSAASGHRAATAAHLAQTEHRVVAVAQQRAPIGPSAGEPGAALLRPTVPVRWIGPDGRPRTLDTSVEYGTTVGTAVPIWIDSQDRLAPTPPTRADIIGAGIGVAFGMLAGTTIVLILIGLLVRRVLDARRLRAWDREWVSVEPRWSAH